MEGKGSPAAVAAVPAVPAVPANRRDRAAEFLREVGVATLFLSSASLLSSSATHHREELHPLFDQVPLLFFLLLFLVGWSLVLASFVASPTVRRVAIRVADIVVAAFFTRR